MVSWVQTVPEEGDGVTDSLTLEVSENQEEMCLVTPDNSDGVGFKGRCGKGRESVVEGAAAACLYPDRTVQHRGKMDGSRWGRTAGERSLGAEHRCRGGWASDGSTGESWVNRRVDSGLSRRQEMMR